MLILILFLLLLAAVLAGSYYAYRITFFSPSQGRDQLPQFSSDRYSQDRDHILNLVTQLQNRPCEFVSIESFDGLTLSGRYYHLKDNVPLDICFHGYRSSCLTDFSGGCHLSFNMEHNLLLVDQRSHGKSQGKTIAFGILERQDALSWTAYALERFGQDVKILLYGISMGGTTVLMASGLDLPANVRGIIADCPYNSPKDIICTVMEQEKMPAKLYWPFVKLGARVFGGFSITQTTAAQAVRTAKVPILLFHGEADTLVPCSMSTPIQAANPGMVSRHTFPNAEHGLSFMIDADRYRQLVYDFVDKVL